ncbi:MAG TPA: TonB-dependent receptor [Luteitalea sp.]|nr:TonB-dependent receptor [Luteitalea sp.]
MLLPRRLAIALWLAMSIPIGLEARQVVTGRVVDQEGTPLAGVVLTTPGETVRTGADGTFLMTDVSSIHDLVAEGYEVARTTASQSEHGVEIVLVPQVAPHREQVVVTAQRQEAETLSVPGSVSVLTRQQITSRLPRTTPEALMDTAGVFVQKTNHGGGSPYLRGMVGNQVLVLVDGVRLNNATYRLGPNQYLSTVDPALVERIEVVRGAGAVLYGTDAIGGVVQIVTRTPTPRGGGWFADAHTTVKGATGALERSARLELEAGRGSVAWLAGVSVKAFGDLRAGGRLGTRAPSSYDEADADLKMRWQRSPGQSLTLAVQRTRQEDVGRFDQVAQRGFAHWAFDPQERWLGSLTYVQDVKAAGIERLTAVLATQRTREDRRSRRSGSAVEILERDVVRVGSGSLDVAWRPLAGWRISSGVDLTTDRVDSARIDTDREASAVTVRRGLYADDAEAGSAAVFTQAQRTLWRLHVEGGARYARYGVRSSAPTFGPIELKADALVGQAGVSVAASTALHPYATVWQGFRAPNIDDVSALGSFDFGVEVPTRTLRPERSLGTEAGLKWRTRRWQGSGSAYRMALRDLIERSRGLWLGQSTYEGQAVYVRDNVGKAYVRGIEIDTSLAFTRSMTLDAWVTQTYGQQVSRDEPMRRIPPLHGALGVSWRPTRHPQWIEARWRGAARQDRLASGDRDDHRIDRNGTAAWHTLAVRAGWRIGAGVELIGAVENGFDQPYRVHGSGIDGPGRTAWLGAHVRLF